MELSEAQERLKDLINTSEKGAINYPDDKELFMTDKEALETVLKALDNSISKDEVEDIYPLTIIKDRYCGAYSNGAYTAWNLDFDEIPSQINDEDVICKGFWINNTILVGKGETPFEAIHNLQELLGE